LDSQTDVNFQGHGQLDEAARTNELAGDRQQPNQRPGFSTMGRNIMWLVPAAVLIGTLVLGLFRGKRLGFGTWLAGLALAVRLGKAFGGPAVSLAPA